ncbi:MAG: hypothetical protein EF807_08765 [Candidatus Methanolliviera hydrocarbonicum]|uniref:GvpL/GvpF family gas vesicle protein n=1 Tax=Candidatus Methanolliviera hydrocarbonicum TaxID=2491085 RepID=A0A520KUC4_9EURY|nr:MAG: hypothetical protein EF807_08765 [Candidatus Methanolliviera hydrocarbonicum]
MLEHNYVIDQATKKFGTVLPFSFDVIVRGDDNTVKWWLDKNYEMLKRKLKSVEDKAEYSVQIFCDLDMLAEKLVSSNQKLMWLKKLIADTPKEPPYLLQRKSELSRTFELMINNAVSSEISRLAKEFDFRIREHVKDMRVSENTLLVPDKYKNKKLIVTFSCLVQEDMVGGLSEVLDEINRREDFAVRFAGPWAPFSFVQFK